MIVKPVDIMWLAGFLEGEGSFVVRTKNLPSGLSQHQIAIQAPSCDLDVLERVLSIAGGQIHGPYKREGHRDIYRWTLTGRSRVVVMMRILRPHMGSRRRGQIDNALRIGEHGSPRIACPFCEKRIMKGHMPRHLLLVHDEERFDKILMDQASVSS